MLQPGKQALIAQDRKKTGEHRAVFLARAVGGFRVDEHELHREIELAQRSRRILRLQNVVLQQELHVVQEFERNFPVNPDDSAVDVDLVICLEGDLQRAGHLSPSRMISETSISPSKFWERPWRAASHTRRSQIPTELRLARSSAGSSLSLLARPSRTEVPRGFMTSMASVASCESAPAARAACRSSIE